MLGSIGDVIDVEKHWTHTNLETNEMCHEETLPELRLIRLKSFFKDFRKEMESQYDIQCEMRVMGKEVEREQHARYLSDPKNCWKMYDQNTAKRGTSDSVVPCEKPKNLEKWWDESFDIIEDWNKFYEE